ncbi:MAG: hypothetical protein JSW61_10970 [Candidatus Thorarchaeota archaeon]|nr:MAG: hypothetical protein JSW61_10970 [Candidatus Thorarchaeota archaeon]
MEQQKVVFAQLLHSARAITFLALSYITYTIYMDVISGSVASATTMLFLLLVIFSGGGIVDVVFVAELQRKGLEQLTMSLVFGTLVSILSVMIILPIPIFVLPNLEYQVLAWTILILSLMDITNGLQYRIAKEDGLISHSE